VPSADKRQRKKENARLAREERIAAEKRRRRFKMARNIGIIVGLFVIIIVIFQVVGGGGKKKATTDTTVASTTPTTKPAVYPAGCKAGTPPRGSTQTYTAPPAMTIDTKKTYVAHVTTTCGAFDIKLDAANAPQTANSFAFLARNKFFDGLSFHRLVPDFVIQGGDPKGDGTGGPGYKLPDEPPKDGYKQGSVAMANSGSGTTGSQFFVVVSDTGAKNLGGPPYKYSSLGTVTSGFDVVQKMMKLAPASDGPPQLPLYIDTVKINES